MKTHILKTVDTAWDAIESGLKRFEVRRNDRFFQAGDTVVLRKVYGEGALYRAGITVTRSGSKYEACDLTFRIGWMLQGGQFGIEPGYVVFQLEPPDEQGPGPQGTGVVR